MLIEIGSGAINRGATAGSGTTYVDKGNPASVDVTITTAKIYTDYIDDITIAIYYLTNGNTLKVRSSAYVSAHESPGLHEYAVSLAALIGDYIGCYFTAGKNEMDTSGGAGLWYVSGEYKDVGDEATFSLASGYAISLYGSGELAVARKRGWWSK